MSTAPSAGGRPTKLTPEVQERICSALRTGVPLETAANHAGIHRDTIYEWLRRGDTEDGGTACHAFADAVRKALTDCELACVAIVKKAALGGSLAAATWLLEHRFASRWGRRDRLDATVKGGITQVDLGRADLSRLSDDELTALEQLYEKIIPSGDPPGAGPALGEGGEGAP